MAFFNPKKGNAPYVNDGYYDTDPIEEITPSRRGTDAQDIPTTDHAAGLNLDGSNIELKVVRPSSFSEVSAIADYLLSGCTVFLNMESTDKEVSRRLLDFVSVVTYCISGNIKKVATSTFIISPKNVDVTESRQNEDLRSMH